MNETQPQIALPKHPYHSFLRRGLYSLALAAGVLTFGTFSFHGLERFSYIDAFYFSSMIATGQGPAPNVVPVTPLGKIFTCVFSFISVGSMIASLGFLFGPFMGRLWHIGILKLEDEIHLRKRGS